MDSENEPPIAPVASLVDARKRREARAAESAGAERITLTHMTYDPIATVGMTVRNDKGSVRDRSASDAGGAERILHVAR
jgi:hypothetical protein